MKQSFFIALVLGGIIISAFLYNPTLKYQGEMLVQKFVDKIGSIQGGDEEKKLYDMVLKIPASDIYKNRDIYKRLSQLNPSSSLYKQKLKYYEGLIALVEKNRDGRSIKRNRDYIDSLISQGTISIDKQMFKIYVDTAFWNTMDYPAKNSFCTAVNNIYTGYFLIDKYSGKTLASSNRLGEINITQ